MKRSSAIPGRLADPLFGLYLMAWVMVHLGRWYHCRLPLLNDHLTDLVAVPVMAHIAQTITGWYIVQDSRYRYPLFYLLFIAAYLSVVFEILLPALSTRYTGDVWDVLAYFTGAVFYYRFHDRILRSFR